LRKDSVSKIFAAMDEALAIFEYSSGKWHVREELQGTDPHVVALHPSRPNRLFCGTFGKGLWVSEDNGGSWKKNGRELIASAVITSLAADPKSIYVGTEPSRLYRSDDGGETWNHLSELESLPSSNSWSFPPRPYTSHVRAIVSDPTKEGRVYAAIEAGALVRSFDAGAHWKDRVDGGPYDTHNLAVSRSAPGRLYSSAGDGYFESLDYGETWRRKIRGLGQTYMYSVAVHPGDPDTVLVSCSPGPWSAYNPANAESHIYRRSEGEGKWTEAMSGLPSPEGTTVSFLVANENSPGEFYACNNRGIFVSQDSGRFWSSLEVPWKPSFKSQHVRHVTLTPS
jgi:photosystem II stability/assembly factor-like uncharacterized protein